jgi:hypothetical protein
VTKTTATTQATEPTADIVSSGSERVALLLAEILNQNLNRLVLDESEIGIVARALMRAKRDGDRQAGVRYATPLMRAIFRMAKTKRQQPSRDDLYSFTRKELGEFEALAQEIRAAL